MKGKEWIAQRAAAQKARLLAAMADALDDISENGISGAEDTLRRALAAEGGAPNRQAIGPALDDVDDPLKLYEGREHAPGWLRLMFDDAGAAYDADLAHEIWRAIDA